jgi:diaminopimelate decarboxylase
MSAEQLAQRHGTPVLVIDLAVVDAAITAFASCANGSELEVSYAAKAFATIEFVRHLARRSIGLDVCSPGELVTAERAGFPRERLTLHGAGKSDEELLAACHGRAGTIIVDGIEELRRLAGLNRECRAAVLLRLNVGIEVRTHAAVRTGGNDTKFGIHTRDEAEAIEVLRANPHLRYAGLHAHLGSQIRDGASYLASADALVDAAARIACAGFTTERLVIGGGFGVATHPGDRDASLDAGATIAAVQTRLAAAAHERKLPRPRLGIEPGRAIVALAGTTLYRVLAVKRQSERTFVVVDGGIAENPRPALYGARHLVVTAKSSAGEEHEVTLCGRSCENDELGVARLPRGVRSGDLLAMCATGAYTYSMAGNYNRFPRPAVVAAFEGSERLLARRERLNDVLRNDVDARDGADESERPRAAL